MHPEICRFPSLHFYDKKLLSATEMANVSATFHENHYFRPYVFFDVVDGHELHGRNAGTLSLCNEHEADAAVEVLRFFKKRYAYEFTGGKIGIITPYKRQLSLLRSRFSSVFGPDVTADMEFNTVDGFQGREVDILILSTVRASDRSAEGQGLNASSIGFVADVRRMNVALTRAKLSLWIIGSARTLQRNVNWAALLKDAQERNVVISLARPYESTFKKTPSSKTCHNLASSDFNTRISAKKMNDPIENVHQTGFNAKEPHERKGRRLDCRVERQTSKHKSNGDLVSTVRKHTTALAADRRSSAVQRKDGKPILEKRLTKAGRQAIVDSKDEGKELEAQQSNPIGTPDTGKEKELSDRFRSSSSVKELVSDVKGRTLLRQPSKAESEMNGHGKFGYQAQGKAVVSLSSTAERVQNKEAKDSVNLRFVDDKSEGTIATRKRQRDAIDALLSSALISSKKHDAPSRSSKRPLSPTTSARVSVRAPKPSRAQNASTNQTQEKRVLSSHCEHHHQNHFSRSRDLDEEWKSFKDLIGDS